MGSRKLRRYFRNEVLERSGLTDWQLGRAISIGLVNRPLGQKRGSYYTEEHIEQARLVARQLAQGCTYIQMKQALKRGLRPAASGRVYSEALQQPFRLPDKVVVLIPVSGLWRDYEARVALADAFFQTHRDVVNRIAERAADK